MCKNLYVKWDWDQHVSRTSSNLLSDPDELPESKFVFIRIAKTGTSTLLSIFYRFIHKHNLNYIRARDAVHMNWEKPGSYCEYHKEYRSCTHRISSCKHTSLLLFTSSFSLP